MNTARTTAALLVPLVLTGCATPHTAEPYARITRIADVNALVLPLDAYRATPAQRGTVQRAEKTLVVTCLGRFGLRADLADPAPPPFAQNARRYGLADEARARELGYSTPEISKRAPRPDLPPKVRQVAWGDGPATVRGRQVPDGGCMGEADRKLRAGLPPAGLLADRLAFTSLEASERDSRVRAAFARWSTCMKGAGLSYATPMAANGDLRFRDARKHHVDPLETGTAVADVRCKRQARLIDIWAGVETAYQKLAIARHRAALDREQRALDARLKNAAQALARSEQTG
ncbi:hypothetical protein [Actinomadura chokoriensis]|uniref:Sensor domain-containing protein n=1 Tax=Actinomadura chokoriensis TaxID=454156 RepID=A0ABV4RBB6_9ACTN